MVETPKMLQAIYIAYVTSLFLFLAAIGYTVWDLTRQTDHRFKSYDAVFLLEYKGFNCIDATREQIRDYYKDRETEFSEELLKGNWLCKQ